MKTLEGEQNRSRSGAACIEPHQVLRVQHIKSVTTTIYTNVHTYTRQPNGTHHVRVFIFHLNFKICFYCNAAGERFHCEMAQYSLFTGHSTISKIGVIRVSKKSMRTQKGYLW